MQGGGGMKCGARVAWCSARTRHRALRRVLRSCCTHHTPTAEARCYRFPPIEKETFSRGAAFTSASPPSGPAPRPARPSSAGAPAEEGRAGRGAGPEGGEAEVKAAPREKVSFSIGGKR